MFNNICKEYMLKEAKENPQNLFPEEACIDILTKITQIFCNHTLELTKILEKNQFVNALQEARMLCDFEERLSQEFDYIAPFYQVGRKEFKEKIDRLNHLKSESKASLKNNILILKEANKTVFPLSFFEYLSN